MYIGFAVIQGVGLDTSTVHACMCVAAGNFPIGQTSSGTPTSLQFVGPPGHDSTILSLLLAAEELFGTYPAPPNPSVCAGCVSNVTVQEVRSAAQCRSSWFYSSSSLPSVWLSAAVKVSETWCHATKCSHASTCDRLLASAHLHDSVVSQVNCLIDSAVE